MTEHERLYELIVEAENKFFRETPCGTDSSRIEKVVGHLLANGVILPPMKIGQIIYDIDGEDVCELKVTSLLLMLHTERGFGAGRMRKLYEPVAEAIRWYIGKFFVGTDACDEEIRQRIEAIHKRIEACSVELVQVPAADAVAVRKKAEAVPAAPVEVPQELAGMDWKTLINKQYEGGFCGKF